MTYVQHRVDPIDFANPMGKLPIVYSFLTYVSSVGKNAGLRYKRISDEYGLCIGYL